MPKEKTTTRKTKARGEKKKKGMLRSFFPLPSRLQLNSVADPNAPKRGLSAYMFFANEQRLNVRDENPGITFGMSIASNPSRADHIAPAGSSY